jgi:Type ISP C-terminal specificity domain
VKPSQENRWRLGPKTVEGGFEAWPSLDELFPINFQGVNHNRGLEGGIIDTDRAALEQRLRAYFAAENFQAAKKVSEEIATARARYDPEKVWLKLKAAGHFRKDAIVPLLTFPFDRRYIYYVASDKWLNEARSEFARNVPNNEWLITVPEQRKASETWPVYASELVNLHVHERGSVVFPRETRGEGLLGDRAVTQRAL